MKFISRQSKACAQFIGLILLIGMLAGSLVSCGKSLDEKNPPNPTIQKITPSPTATYRSTRTARPTLKPTNTPIPPLVIADAYALPDWVKDPNTNILMEMALPSPHEEAAFILRFLNVLLGDWYTLPLPKDRYNYFWLDNMHFGFTAAVSQKIYTIDVKTGQVTKGDLSDNAVARLQEYYPGPIRAKWDTNNNDYVFSIENVAWRRSVSKTGRFSLDWDSNTEKWPISVTDNIISQVVWKLEPAAGWQNSDYAWSPIDDTILAVVQGKPSGVDFNFPVLDNTLYVYRITTGELLASYQDDIGNIEWSPDGMSILYRDALSLYWNFGYGFKKAPCIYRLQSNDRRCLLNIRDRLPLPGYSLTTTTNYQWSPTGDSIWFDYQYSSPDGNKGVLCNFNLITGSFVCPTDNLSALPEWSEGVQKGYWKYGWSVYLLNVSEDQKYIHFCFSSNNQMSDDQSGPSHDAVMQMNGQGLLYWFSKTEPSRCSMFGSTWRPLP
jgi:hypothetical protein